MFVCDVLVFINLQDVECLLINLHVKAATKNFYKCRSQLHVSTRGGDIFKSHKCSIIRG